MRTLRSKIGVCTFGAPEQGTVPTHCSPGGLVAAHFIFNVSDMCWLTKLFLLQWPPELRLCNAVGKAKKPDCNL